MGELAWGTRTFFTRGLRAIGKAKMRLGMYLCRDNGYEDCSLAMMDEARVPPNWEEFSSNESIPMGTEPFPVALVFEGPDPVTDWLYDGSQWKNYIQPGELAVNTPPAPTDAG